MFAVMFSESITLIELTVMSWLNAADVSAEPAVALKCVKRPRIWRVRLVPCCPPLGEMASRSGRSLFNIDRLLQHHNFAIGIRGKELRKPTGALESTVICTCAVVELFTVELIRQYTTPGPKFIVVPPCSQCVPTPMIFSVRV